MTESMRIAKAAPGFSRCFCIVTASRLNGSSRQRLAQLIQRSSHALALSIFVG
jgi:hypothetical protein